MLLRAIFAKGRRTNVSVRTLYRGKLLVKTSGLRHKSNVTDARSALDGKNLASTQRKLYLSANSCLEKYPAVHEPGEQYVTL